MKSNLKAGPRDTVRRGELKELRRRGLIPAVVYGFGKEAEKIQIDILDLKPVLKEAHGSTLLIDLALEGKGNAVTTVIREVQRHPVSREILHCDLLKVDMKRKYHVTVPVIVTGESVGVKNFGGVVDQNLREIEINCRPAEIPEHYTLDVTDLEIGDSIRVSDIPIGDEELVTLADTMVVSVIAPRKSIEEEEAEAAEALAAEEGVEEVEGAEAAEEESTEKAPEEKKES